MQYSYYEGILLIRKGFYWCSWGDGLYIMHGSDDINMKAYHDFIQVFELF